MAGVAWEWAGCLGSFLEEPGPAQTPAVWELGWGQMNPPAFNSGPRLPSTFPAFPITPNSGSLEGSPAASRWWSSDAEAQVSLLGVRKGGREGKVQVTETEQMRASLCPDCAGKCGQGLPGTSKTLYPSFPHPCSQTSLWDGYFQTHFTEEGSVTLRVWEPAQGHPTDDTDLGSQPQSENSAQSQCPSPT